MCAIYTIILRSIRVNYILFVLLNNSYCIMYMCAICMYRCRTMSGQPYRGVRTCHQLILHSVCRLLYLSGSLPPLLRPLLHTRHHIRCTHHCLTWACLARCPPMHPLDKVGRHPAALQLVATVVVVVVVVEEM